MSEFSPRGEGDRLFKKITRRTTGAKGNNFLRVITSFNKNQTASNRKKATDKKQQIASNAYQEADNK